ncbi:MAG TPA: hypothetical protein VN643_04320 [Pyrinomonadaceae bacterium]|nr:hypothetical protein [Pyrinomonadaceae bacterium]
MIDKADTESGDQSRKRLRKIVGGGLIALGMIFGLVTALTQEYFYLVIGGPALLIGAFLAVLSSREVNKVPSTYVWFKAFQVGIGSTILGGMYVYWDGFSSTKSLIPLFGVALIAIGGVAYRRAKLAEAAAAS